ncbi:MAG: TIGR01777 family oxidoreductase [Caldimicrobium sp.]
MKKLFLLGGSGFIGSYLTSYFLDKGWKVTLLIRNPNKLKELPTNIEIVLGDALKEGDWQKKIAEADLVINLVGETIFKRWTPDYKKRIWDSRILSTERVVEALSEKNVLFNASAVGYYGDRGEEILTEDSPKGTLYVSELCDAWEKSALKGKEKGARVILGRFGIVLGKGGGMLSVILPIFRLGLGGKLGSGKQWFPWIHLEDLARAIEFLYENKAEGVFNFSSPNPIRNEEMTKLISKILKRPTLFPVPKFALKLIYGELAETIMASARVIPKRLLELSFSFKYPSFEEALKVSLKS